MNAPVPCRYCPALLIWSKSEKGNAMCFDAAPSLNGRWSLVTGTAVYVRPVDEEPGMALYESHWASCSGRDRARADHPKKASR